MPKRKGRRIWCLEKISIIIQAFPFSACRGNFRDWKAITKKILMCCDYVHEMEMGVLEQIR